jgi:hypothetical protein
MLFSHLHLGFPSNSFCQVHQLKLHTFFISPCMLHVACCSAYLNVHNLITLTIFDEEHKYEAPHYAVFSILCHFLPIGSIYSHQYPVLRHSQSVFFPYCEKPNFISIQNIYGYQKCCTLSLPHNC